MNQNIPHLKNGSKNNGACCVPNVCYFYSFSYTFSERRYATVWNLSRIYYKIKIFNVFKTNLIKKICWNSIASALHCWHCNNEQQPFCDDPFDVDKMTDAQKSGSTAQCPAGAFERSVCIKMVSFSKYYVLYVLASVIWVISQFIRDSLINCRFILVLLYRI